MPRYTHPDPAAESLWTYARQTAADTGEDFATACRMMRDEPQHVAADLACPVDVVVSWCEEMAERPEG